MNTIGRNLRLTTFGESHGPAMGGVIDGFPAGFKINFEKLKEDISKRKPGSSSLVTARNEDDEPEFLSGLTDDGITLGTPIGFIVRNKDHHSSDYDDLKDKFRPNHADYTYITRYGIRDHKGGGRASARETVNWVIAGSLASQWLESQGVQISTVLSSVGEIDFSKELKSKLIKRPFELRSLSIPEEISRKFSDKILSIKKEGNSIGGAVTCLITGVKAGIGNPVFSKLQASLAQAMMSINAAKGFEYGSGFESKELTGIESQDIFFKSEENHLGTLTNYSGGIQGGIANGMPIFFTVAFKPTPTVLSELPTVDIQGNPTLINSRGRHDPCVAVRAVAVVRAMAALTITDALI